MGRRGKLRKGGAGGGWVKLKKDGRWRPEEGRRGGK
jgi:hypothetical protein